MTARSTCAAARCNNKIFARIWCRRHYERWRAGRPLHSPFRKVRYPEERTTVPIADRFWAKADISGGPDACWPWTGMRYSARSQRGLYYGAFMVANKKHYAHRIAYELRTGRSLGNTLIDHACHNTLCVNPTHLRPVTNKQNQENRKGPERTSQARVRGVRPNKNGWQATVQHNGKRYCAGTYRTIEEAGEAARRKRIELFTHNDVDRYS